MWRPLMPLADSYENVLVEKADGITTVTLNRPDQKNAMSPALHQDMFDVLTALEYDSETRVLVLTGAGDAFCAGQDLKKYFHELEDDVEQRERLRRLSHAWRHRLLYNFPKPTIAMVNGYCFGGAFT